MLIAGVVDRLLHNRMHISPIYRPAHHLHGTVVKLRRDPRFTLRLAPRHHAQSGNQHDGGIRIPHRRRIGPPVLHVVRLVILPVVGEPVLQHLFQQGQIALGRIPRHIERLDLGAEEMVRAGRAQFGQPRGILAIHEAQDGGVFLNRTDHPLTGGNPAPKPGKNPQPEGTSLLLPGSGEFGTTKRFLPLVLLRDRRRLDLS